MARKLFTLALLLAILGPFAAQSTGRPTFDDVYGDVLVQNLCATETNEDFYESAASITLDDRQVASLRIELLERGFDPGFDDGAIDADAKLTASIQMFQAESWLPSTGLPDPATMFLLGMRAENTNHSEVWQLIDAFVGGRRMLLVTCRPNLVASGAHP